MAKDSGVASVLEKPSSHPFDLLLEIDRRNHSRATPMAETAGAMGRGGRLALRLGAWNLLFAMDDVAELIPFPRVTRVPGVKPWLLGIANLRGKVVSVIDLQEFLGGRPTQPNPSNRLAVIHSGQWVYGLLVHEIIGMRHFGRQQLLPTLDSVETSVRTYLTEGYESEGQHWLVFNVTRLLNDPKFLQATN